LRSRERREEVGEGREVRGEMNSDSKRDEESTAEEEDLVATEMVAS